MFADLAVSSDFTSPSLQALTSVNNRYLRDLKLNVAGVLNSQHISRKHAILLALATVINQKHEVLIAAFTTLAEKEGATPDEIAEVHGCVSLMSLNNVFYRFRHYMHGNEYYNKTPAGLRMSIMMNPVLGKEFFELLSLMLSALNGCERCVTSHEHSVKEHGATEARIYDAIRLTSVIKSLCIAY